ncbi:MULTISPECIES: hypothetical protein [Streptomyces]|uniref:hypothetical protein n=1 Tax=Streptomyces TaxID=1883 RepID=UPI0019292DCE|nr:hypothetical protein [Streptomyces sp. SID685]
MIQLNVCAVADLTRALLPQPAADGRGALGTVTSTVDVVGSRDAVVGHGATPADVVTATRRALERPRAPPSIVAGLGNRLSALAAR